MIRLILVLIAVIVYLLVGILLQLIEWMIGKFNKPLKDRSSLALIKGVFRVILFLSGTKVTVLGKENVPTDQAVLYVGNHRSYFDIVIGYTLVPGLTGFVAKKEMEKIPLLSLWMKMLYCLFLDRKDIKEGMKTILKGIEYVKKGISIWIFPEGTRNRNEEGSMLPFHEGSLKIAEKGKCPIIPVAFHHTADIFEAHVPFIRRAEVTVEFGKPIIISELEKDQKKFLGAYTQDIIAQMIREPGSTKR